MTEGLLLQNTHIHTLLYQEVCDQPRVLNTTASVCRMCAHLNHLNTSTTSLHMWGHTSVCDRFFYVLMPILYILHTIYRLHSL